MLVSAATWAQESNDLERTFQQLNVLPFEQLLSLEVSTVTRTERTVGESAAAVSVITQEDIRRSGARSLPEVLRLAPGVEVARLDAHQWAVSVRGFNDVFANKLLVLIDGRSVYTPLFSGVFWDVQNPVLEDIERIEVIRGPGAAVWGANAVNGVINVITKKAAATQGWMATGGGGNENLGFGTLRYGGKLGADATYRVFGKYFALDDSELRGGGTASDKLQLGRGGFRLDWNATANDAVSFQTEGYGGREHEAPVRVIPIFPFARLEPGTSQLLGGHLLGRWQHDLDGDADWWLQTYYDHTRRNAVELDERRHTFDIEFQNRFHWGTRQELVWGANYRLWASDTKGSFDVSFLPAERTAQLAGLFVQDEIELIKERLRLTVGSKFEHNDFTGFEVQPNGRLLLKLNPQHSIWTAVGRAVRTPSQAEDSTVVNVPGIPPGVAPLLGSRSFAAEELLATEVGYRAQLRDELSVDLATFYNSYDQLRSLEPMGSLPGAITGGNRLSGETYGAELTGRWQVSPHWALLAQYSLLQVLLHTDRASGDTTSERAEGNDPQHQVAIRSQLNLPRQWEFDTALRFVDELPAFNVPAYLTLDLRLGWRPHPNWELALVGQNLLSPHHPEFGPTLVPTQFTEVERSVYGKVTWRF